MDTLTASLNAVVFPNPTARDDMRAIDRRRAAGERRGPRAEVAVPAGRLALPGPVDPARLLWLELVEGASAEVAGPLSAAR